jgi:hypothetical protein
LLWRFASFSTLTISFGFKYFITSSTVTNSNLNGSICQHKSSSVRVKRITTLELAGNAVLAGASSRWFAYVFP